ncbi:MAG TPA: hypothetical protein PKA20_01145 [Burkholderiaceae bacterium]|nr:hypothetical protein [Burkholderiaceae bacterium]
MTDYRPSLPERIRRLVKRVGAAMAGGSILLWLTPLSRGWSEELLAIGLIGIAAAWSAASGGRFDGDSGGGDWFDVDDGGSGDGDSGDGGD